MSNKDSHGSGSSQRPQFDQYSALSPREQLVAQIYGVIAPQMLGVRQTAQLADKAGITLEGRWLRDSDVRAANSTLTAAGIAVRQKYRGGSGVRAAANWAVELTRQAHEAGHMRPILRAFKPSYWDRYWESNLFESRFRCYLLGGNFDEYEQLVEHRSAAHLWDMFADPLATDVLESLPEKHLEEALWGCLQYVIGHASNAEPVIACCQRLSRHVELHAADIALIRILQGRFDDAEAVFNELPPAVRESRLAQTGLASTRGLIALLRGDDLAARREIDAALAAEKAGSRKRHVFPYHFTFATSLLALVRMDTLESTDLLTQLLRSAATRRVEREFEVWLVAKAAGIGGRYQHYGPFKRGGGLEALFECLGHCWSIPSYQAGYLAQDLLLEYYSRALANGFKWLIAECSATLLCLSEQGEVDAINAVDWTDPDAAHAALGTRSLVVLREPMPEWEHSLKSLERLAQDASEKERNRSTQSTQVEKRLVWEANLDSYGIRVQPREQRRNKNGTWSKGRNVALKRLALEAASLDFLTGQDRAAAGSISAVRVWNKIDYVLDSGPGLYALAGHPHVFDQHGEPLEIYRREPELHVEEGVDGIAIVRIEPHGGEEEREFGITLAAQNRIEVTRFSESHRKLFEIVEREGLSIPPDGKSRLLEAVSALASQVRVQSTAGPVAGAKEVDADAEPWVRLEPFAAGLTAALLVEPIAGSGIFFEPGKGGVTVFAGRESEHVQAHRDLARERDALRRLIEQCPRLASQPTEYAPLVISEPAESLELLEQLNDASARCKWPKGEPLRIVARYSTSSLSLKLRTAEEWLQASGELAVDDDTVLDFKRLFALLKANPGSRFLELERGQFLALTQTFRRQLDDLASLSAPIAKGAVRLHALAAASLGDLFEEADLAPNNTWLKLRRELDSARAFEPELPSTLQAELRPYQVDGYRWLSRLSRLRAGACLADDMGLGKTVQTLAVLLGRAPGGPALVVAPTSVVANWVDEARRFAPTLNVKMYTGGVAERVGLLDEQAPFDLFVTTYGVMQNDIERLREIAWHSLVLDEAQAIKNPTTRRAHAARRLNAEFRVVTTGTPIQNNLMDLHSLFNFLNPGLLGSQERFRDNFAEPGERDGNESVRTRLRRLVAPFMLRRLKTEVLDDLPERTEITLHVTLSPEEASLYELLRKQALEQLEAARNGESHIGEGERFQILAHLTRLRLACCNAKLVLDDTVNAPASSKLNTFAETLAELLAGRHKVLVFSQFVKHLKLVEDYLLGEGISYQYLDGSTPAKARRERIAAFQAGQGDVFLISLKAGGTGLNLTAADYVIHMDPWWNPAVEDQASDRAHRIGQTRPVTIYRLVSEGTIEEQIVELHRHKRDLAYQLLEGADAVGKLSTDELLELLRQSP